MKQLKDYNQVQQIKIKKVLLYNNINGVSDTDIVDFEGLNLKKIIIENKEYLFNDNIVLNS